MLLSDILDIEYPMIQGGMTSISDGSFAAACSNEGILGVIGSGAMNLNELRNEIRICRESTNRPFGVNLIMTRPDIESFVELMIEECVPVVITGNGNALKYVPKWKATGIKVISVIGVPQAARFAERSGVDVLVAEGMESGGYIGSLSTMTLVPQICDRTKLPVVAAGGIADYRQYKAALALGACGVQVGTALLASTECPIHKNYKKLLFKSKSTDSIVTGEINGDPVRVIANKMSKTYLEMERKNEPAEKLNSLVSGSLKKAVVDGDVDGGSFMAGLVCGQIFEERSLKAIIRSVLEGD